MAAVLVHFRWVARRGVGLGELALRSVIALFLGVVAAGTVGADAPQSNPDWSSDRFLVGTWLCDAARPGRPLAHERATYSLGLNDRWLKLSYTLSTGEPDAQNLTTDAYESFDVKLKKWVYISVRSDGEYGNSYSDGWHGATKIYGPDASSKEKWRFVVTKISSDEIEESAESGSADGHWTRSMSLHCKKVK
jgi:hypothetical protein